jgi:hypothetical protein
MVLLKGEPIRFVGGKYQGLTGWMNAAQKPTTHYVPVLVNMGNKVIDTKVMRASVAIGQKQQEVQELGGKVRFVAGKYKGLTGCLDRSRKETPKQVPVILDLGNQKVQTRVFKSSVTAIQNGEDVEEVNDAKGQDSIPRKGSPNRIIGGLYKGRSGWKDLAKGETKCYFYVIIDMGDNTEKATMVYKQNVAAPHKPPTSIQEATIQQYPAIDEAMTRLSYLLSTLEFSQPGLQKTTISNKTVKDGFMKQLDAMISEFVITQGSLGNEADWNTVEFSSTKAPLTQWENSLAQFANALKPAPITNPKRRTEDDNKTPPNMRTERDTSMDGLQLLVDPLIV